MRRRPLLVLVNWRDLEHPESGGAELVAQVLAAGFAAKAEREVVLVCAAVEGKPAKEHHPDGYTIVRHGSRLGVYPAALAWLLAHRHRISAVVDCQNGIPFFTPLVLPRSTPILLLLHHVHQEQFARYFSPPMAAVGRFLESTASRWVYGERGILSISPSTRAGVRRTLGLKGDIWVCPPGWSVSEEVIAQPGPRSASPKIVCVGRLVPHKRTELVLQGFVSVLREHPDATLTIVGRGPEREGLITRARELGLGEAVSFRDDLDDVGRDRELSTAWLGVHASQGEGWGLSVLEGNVLGVPCLAYRRPGLRDSIVDGETGWLIDDDADLGRAMSQCLTELSDPGRASQLSQRARHWASRFTWERMVVQAGAALESERKRLQRRGADRRGGTDLATVITLPAQALPYDFSTRLRATDVWDATSPEIVTILCRGADTQTVPALLDRLGLPRETTEHEGFSVSVARTRDLLRLTPVRPSSDG